MPSTKIQNTDNTKSWQDVEQQKRSFIAGGNATWYSHPGRQFGDFIKPNILLLPDPANALLSVYPKKLKLTSIQKPTHRCL